MTMLINNKETSLGEEIKSLVEQLPIEKQKEIKIMVNTALALSPASQAVAV